MSSPSNKPSSRCLRLERLENRSLLAGGLFAVSLAELTGRDDGLDQFDSGNPSRNDGNPQRVSEFRGQSGQRTNFDRQNDTRQSAQNRQQPQASPNTPPAQILARDVITLQSSQFVQPTQQASTSNLPGAGPPAAAIDAALAAITDASNDSTDEADNRVTSTLAAEVSTIEPTDTQQRVSLPQARTNSAFTTPNVITLQSSESSGTVDLTPLLQTLPFQSSDIQDEAPWKLDSRILPRLKQAIEVSPDELAQLADKVVTERFGGPGGLVAVDQVQLPSGLFMLDDAVVDIRLESSLQLYRTLELFATSTSTQIALPISGPISDQALDAIMTTIGSLADSETQPVGEPASFKLSTFAYPAIAVAATGAAISSRRKIRQPRFSMVRQ